MKTFFVIFPCKNETTYTIQAMTATKQDEDYYYFTLVCMKCEKKLLIKQPKDEMDVILEAITAFNEYIDAIKDPEELL